MYKITQIDETTFKLIDPNANFISNLYTGCVCYIDEGYVKISETDAFENTARILKNTKNELLMVTNAKQLKYLLENGVKKYAIGDLNALAQNKIKFIYQSQL